ncbi:aminotransferase class V-fold PLP-dependent enzyme [Pullulanibacillus sp. KACC 23026]|uniref:aminotransferase class V-fold PLP-dependent enzyme n=1 Tax=Pullulanibacillus sp. KACC 23026 TaxID=3028315 RepID=UPI0023AF037D|nr:aminotransferase class V-fold PLP-dependent enzyme [Pullulanibacillus sp. KACC 23026]WEG14613.1 aminotransferase class V-fold PLP-dependent enzyme [Pullulanibacillus sp. KACC 23026]
MITAQIGTHVYRYQTDLERYFKAFREEIVGLNQTFESPYGTQRIIYTDWIASGRLYYPIETKVREVFGPFYGNTHSESSVTGQTMKQAYEEAKKLLKKHVHADDQDVIMLEDSGMTSVLAKFQRIMGLKGPETWKKKIDLQEADRPVVFISHMEHDSNQISWEETIADVVIVPRAQDGRLDMAALERLLVTYRERPLKIGAFTACSNVTGLRLPHHQLARKLHEAGGICIIDFAASAPYDEMNMHPEDPIENLDALFFSTHKFLGGPGGSGVGIFGSHLYHNRVPDEPGGGSVNFTNPWGIRHYVKDIETREDSGTPGILQGIRAGLAVKLKEKMGTEKIKEREKELLAIIMPQLKSIPGVHVLEGQVEDRLGIVSFVVEDLHYNLIVRLLNDRFGYQVRGGCLSACTYGHILFNIDKIKSKMILDQINQGNYSFKPGYVRLSIHPTMTNEEAYGFIKAMKQIVQNQESWKQDYVYDAKSNNFLSILHNRRDYNQLFEL